jgi:hypothetical protein
VISVVTGRFTSLYKKQHKANDASRSVSVSRRKENQQFTTKWYCLIKVIHGSVFLESG